MCIIIRRTYMLNISFLASTNVELYDLIVFIVVNEERFQSPTVTLTLIRQCPLSNMSEIFAYTTTYSNFRFLDWLLFELSCKHTHTHTHGCTNTHRLWWVLYSCVLQNPTITIFINCVYALNKNTNTEF